MDDRRACAVELFGSRQLANPALGIRPKKPSHTSTHLVRQLATVEFVHPLERDRNVEDPIIEREPSAFRMRHHDEPDAQELADQCQHEIDVWQACSEFYGYEFLVLRAR